MKVSGAIEPPGHVALGEDAGLLAGAGRALVQVTSDMDAALSQADAVIDFTIPRVSVEIAGLAAKHRKVHICGTTGCSDAENDAIASSARIATIVKSGNFSLGVNLLAALVKRAAEALDDDFDIEVVEMHHNRKVDAPSGTALKMGETVAAALGRDLGKVAVYGREGVTGERDPSTIGFATVRGGDSVGDHTVLFAGIGERIEITHRAASRVTYAHGSLRACRFLVGKGNGVYDMQDVLGLR